MTLILWLFVTVAAYELGRWIRKRTGSSLAQPVAIAIAIIGVLLAASGTAYDDYADATTLISFLLGPATVALAIPLYHQTARLKGMVVPVLVALGAGAVVSMVSGILLVRWLGGSDALERTMATKAVTAPVTIALADRLGGYPELSACFAIVIGIVGAMLGPRLLTLLGVRDPRARGVAVGAVSHGVGTARMLEEGRVEGAFSGLAMGLTAVVTCLLLPLVAHLLL
ncbi:putative murein hydrolase (TIGR00659 family) [Nocardioides albertanoniae]|uniref:Putative murein hydrolase (TIGR00659 family) n=1 Tax=Nocardioides albertanoniae TaxID=1175486 RepID=A0A543AD68_9ACTN|nr:LrgB family protein [Nocardioides albertanoniae]TQL70528.1 putative murein hydrolase (TIGR00659 family) [Nocardioides albertanoniae]